MSYLFKERCVSTAEELHSFVAADCPAISNGYTITCTPTTSGVDMTFYDPATATTINHSITPSLIDCPDLIADAIELSWMVAGVWVAAWSFRELYKLVRS
ncbi:hypothetical protein SAMN05216326_1528 [Nitrosomonas marina]|uniref:Uncharacterized protein n=1 Tax=Nitrosomonas marina TaxID=917 RepID=A0A1I0G3C1_9PROT|nr:hypothetical protein [Nitrosomonas marina]SET65093.1 hypothetical protein SAMN05216326_1528 [Nitrosomonas marina]